MSKAITLNLKNARRLESEIVKQLEKLRMEFRKQANISVYETESTAVVLGGVAERNAEIVDDVIDLEDARYFIRTLIGEANEDSGINTWMAEQNKLRSILGLFNEIEDSSEEYTEELINKTNKQKEAMSATPSQYRDSVGFRQLLTTSDLGRFKDLIPQYKRKLVEMQDQCAAANVSQTVTIGEGFVKILEKYSLV